MPREPLPFKREFKGDIIINIVDIFRNPDIQKEAIKECKKFESHKNKHLILNLNK